MSRIATGIVLSVCLSMFGANGVCAETRTGAGKQISAVILKTPLDAKETGYLGLDGADSTFSLSDIKGKQLIVEIFNPDCHTCQEQAPNVENLYDMIQKSGRGDEIKMIGIGVYSSEREVAVFKSRYKIRFPLFHDLNNTIYEHFHESGTPQFVKLKRGSGKGYVMVQEGIGNMHDPKAFMDSLGKEGLRDDGPDLGTGNMGKGHGSGK